MTSRLERIRRVLENGVDLFARDTREIRKKSIERLSCAEVIEQVLDWDPGAKKAGRSAHAFGIDPNNPKEGITGLDSIAGQVFRLDRSRQIGGLGIHS